MEKLPSEERDLLLSHMKAIEEYLIEHAQPLFPYQDRVKLRVDKFDALARFELYIFRDHVSAKSDAAHQIEAKKLGNLEWDDQVLLLDRWEDVKWHLKQQLEAQADATYLIRNFKL